jgi:DNA-binding response OmpR family regulator
MTASRFIVAGPIRIEPLVSEVAVLRPSAEYMLVGLKPKEYEFLVMLAGRLNEWVPKNYIAEALYRTTTVGETEKQAAARIAFSTRERIIRLCPDATRYLLAQRMYGYILRTTAAN